jgi:acyl-CoA reductase-like NAD-dependent aldehyde dehydrogenase
MPNRLASMSFRIAPPRALACAAWRRHLSGRRTIEVVSPRDGAPFATLHDWTASDVDAAIESGGRHLVSEWAGRSDLAIERRRGVLRHIGASLRMRAEELAQLESRDCGKPIAESRVDIETCAALFDYYAEIAPEMLADQPIALPDVAGAFRARVVPHAVGMVGAVTPWNYPLMQAVVGSLVGC